jgi:hypothetical protein
MTVSVLSTHAQAQAEQAQFDPAHPFAGVASPEQWWAKFHTGQPKIVAGDPWGNMTSTEIEDKATGGYWAAMPGKTPAKVVNLHEPDPRGERSSRNTGGTGVMIRSPYPYKTAQEQYDAWLAAAHGGTKMTRATLPDWSGDWVGGAQGVLHGSARISDVMAAVSPEYRPRYTQYLHAEWEGHTWWPQAFCMPHGFPQTLSGNGGTWHFMSDQHLVLINRDRDSDPFFDIYTDGRGFAPPGKLAPQWYGESVGFWDGDELVVYTKNVKRWMMGVGLPETSDKLESVMRLKRFGDKMLMDVTVYDPEAFAFPWHDVGILHTLPDWRTAPQSYVNCVYTNNVFLGQDGSVDEHLPGDPGYRNPTDRRPWATAFELWDNNHAKLNAQWEASFKQDEAAAKGGK